MFVYITKGELYKVKDVNLNNTSAEHVNNDRQNLTDFQQQLLDASLRVHVMLHEVGEAVDTGNEEREHAMRKELIKAEAAFLALVQRAVDSNKPRMTNDDGIWVRIDE